MSKLPERAQAILGPLPPGVARALGSVPAAPFLPSRFAVLAGADAPLPFYEGATDAALTPSPRVAALLLQLLDLDAAPRVLIVGAESGYLAALALEAGAAHVRIAAPSREVAETARGYVEAAGLKERIDVLAGPPAKAAGDGAWDRILLLDASRTLTAALAARLADLGFALAIVHTSQGWEVVKTIKSETTLAEIRAPRLRLPGGVPGAEGVLVPHDDRKTLDGLLRVEEVAARVWRGGSTGSGEAALRDGVEETWRRPAKELESLRPAERERRGLAMKAFHLGYVHQAAGDLENAADLYIVSDQCLPSAEARTFLGWVRALQGRLEEAIACCHRAIAADPSLGNPYNDIGAYLVQLGRPDEALAWLERALQAPRYQAAFFPHLNLARVHLARGDADAARSHLKQALELNPGYAPAAELLKQLEGSSTRP